MTAYVRANRDTLRGQPLLDGELDVLLRVSHGLTNYQIGIALGISENGVKSRLRVILAKLDAVDRAHAVRRGFEHGLLHAHVERRVAS